MTQTMNASKARQEWSQLLNRIQRGDDRVVVEKSGVPVAAIISPTDLERLKRYEAEESRAWATVDAIRGRNAGEDPEAVLRDVTAVVEDVRQALYDKEQALSGRR